jgi:glycosyltransferase involved in cell wall biosynthesis
MTRPVPMPAPTKVLLSAYACEPDRGSEPGVGWNWMLALLQRGLEVWVLTRANNRPVIEEACARLGLPLGTRLHFVYHDLPPWVLKLKRRGWVGTQLYYELWQRTALAVARQAHAQHRFDLCHHLTFGVWRHSSPLYRLGVPFVFGPVGGGEEPPWTLVRTLPLRDRLAEHARHAVNAVAAAWPGVRRCLRASALVLAKTPETARWIAKAGAASRPLLEIGIDCDAVPEPPRRALRGGLRCLFAGRLVGLKGVHLAVRACAHLARRGVDIELTIVGKGPQRERLESLVREQGLASRVRFVDWLDRAALFAEYAAHDVLVFPSLHDSSGNVVLEAFSQGLPVVCLARGGPGVMVDGSNGIAVPAPDDATEDQVCGGLADALQRLADDRSLRQAMSAAALATARRMTWAAAVEAVYADPGLLPAAVPGARPSLPARASNCST